MGEFQRTLAIVGAGDLERHPPTAERLLRRTRMLMVTTAAGGVDAAEGIQGSHQPARVGVELRGRTGLAGLPYSGAVAA